MNRVPSLDHPRGLGLPPAAEKWLERAYIYMKHNRNNAGVGGNSDSMTIVQSSVGSGSGGGSVDTAQPPALSGLIAVPGLEQVLLAWDATSFANYAYANIYRNTVDNYADPGTILIDRAPGRTYSDDTVSPGVTYYYWITALSVYYPAAPEGPINQLAGTEADVPLNPEYVLDFLGEQITESHLWQNLNNRLDLIDVGEDALDNQLTFKLDENGYVAGYGLSITTNDYDEGEGHSQMLFAVDRFAVGAPGKSTMSFVIDGNRVAMNGASIVDATIGDAKIGSVSADKMYAASGTIAEALIGVGEIQDAMIGGNIQSSNFVGGQTGWFIGKSGGFFTGYAEFQNIKARGDIEATSIKADAANIVSTLMVQGNAITASSFAEKIVNTNGHSLVLDVDSVPVGSTMVAHVGWIVNEVFGNPVVSRIRIRVFSNYGATLTKERKFILHSYTFQSVSFDVDVVHENMRITFEAFHDDQYSQPVLTAGVMITTFSGKDTS